MRAVLGLLLLGMVVRGEEPAVKEVSPGVLQAGLVRVERASRTAWIPAAVNQDEGPLEYLLVTEQGPVHESLLTTTAAPRDLHMAMLLLGAKGSPVPATAPPSQLTAEFLRQAPAPTGEAVLLKVRWTKDGETKSAAAEELLLFGEPLATVPAGPWTYTGSAFTGAGKFAAQVEGYFVALVTNGYALINNPRPSRTDDQHWQANRALLPPRGTAVEVRVQLAP